MSPCLVRLAQRPPPRCLAPRSLPCAPRWPANGMPTPWPVCRAPAECPQEVSDLITRCLSRDPDARPTATELVELLQAAPGTPPESGAAGGPRPARSSSRFFAPPASGRSGDTAAAGGAATPAAASVADAAEAVAAPEEEEEEEQQQAQQAHNGQAPEGPSQQPRDARQRGQPMATDGQRQQAQLPASVDLRPSRSQRPPRPSPLQRRSGGGPGTGPASQA